VTLSPGGIAVGRLSTNFRRLQFVSCAVANMEHVNPLLFLKNTKYDTINVRLVAVEEMAESRFFWRHGATVWQFFQADHRRQCTSAAAGASQPIRSQDHRHQRPGQSHRRRNPELVGLPARPGRSQLRHHDCRRRLHPLADPESRLRPRRPTNRASGNRFLELLAPSCLTKKIKIRKREQTPPNCIYSVNAYDPDLMAPLLTEEGGENENLTILIKQRTYHALPVPTSGLWRLWRK
jgi:hypothetical protein